MPTAARLVAALCLAGVAYVVSGMVIPLLPEGTDIGYFVPVNVLIGLVVGWTVMGSRAGRGTTAAINNGVTGVFMLVLWAIVVQAANEMVRRAMLNRYDDVFEAIVAVFEIGAEYAVLIATLPIGIALIVGALVSGLVTEYAARHWK